MKKKTTRKTLAHRDNKGVSTDPKARASQEPLVNAETDSASVHAPDALESSAPSSPSERPRLVKTVSVDLIKPLGDDTWERIGQRLHDLRGCMHRLLNTAVRHAALGPQDGASVLRSARAGVRQAVADERAYWTTRVGKAFEGSNHDPHKAARLAELHLPSAIQDYVATRAVKAFLDARKHMARGDKSLPSFNNRAPIPLRNGPDAWELQRTDRGWELAFKLYPGNAPKIRFAIRVHSASAHADLRRMFDPSVSPKLGDARIVWHQRRGKSQWEARLCYSYEAPKPAAGPQIVAVHRGMHQFLTIVDSLGHVKILPGTSYLRRKNQFHERRRELQAHIRKGELGHGARGRGTRRRHRSLHELDDAEARMMKSACQEASAMVNKCARAAGDAALLVLEDYTTIRAVTPYLPHWPWAQLKTTVEWGAQKEGREVRSVPAAYLSQICPACDGPITVSAGRTGSCACGLRLAVDTIAALNMIKRSGIETPPGPDGLTAIDRITRHAKALAASMRHLQDAAE